MVCLNVVKFHVDFQKAVHRAVHMMRRQAKNVKLKADWLQETLAICKQINIIYFFDWATYFSRVLFDLEHYS